MSYYCWHPYYFGELSDKYLQKMLFKFGPISGTLDARNRAMKYVKDVYKGGCTRRSTHAILIVGYSPRYWIIKNSWGPHWGKHGYFRLPRKRNKCGINYVVGVPFIK